MGREVRRVPSDWAHPTDESGHYKPLLDGDFAETLLQWEKEFQQWNAGLVRSYLADGEQWKPKPQAALECASFEEWHGERPDASDYMPQWADEQRTHFQMYENVSEGTPISPVMESPEALARWLVDNNAPAFGSHSATYEGWLRVAQGGYAPSFVILGRRMMSGVDGVPGGGE